ncbi:group II truncated hemoglobin [Phytohabitans suffuscus]|uniref:Oxidoreductase n=1 Tax=Phytohabitans suffuscus TaxID=624315 RepID=A0A6F8YXD2_9ACTN|nr:group II truncated hemoglobin [Phytohabitans suffuscus]BCB90830.1 oxidoreductase [Phytohabitans suffuscus]
MRSVYEAAGGQAGLLRLAEAWHTRVLADEVVSHAFERGFHPRHSERLAAYWGEALGGPPAYTAGIGDESTVVRMHSGNGPHEEMDRRAIACFDAALGDVGLAPGEPLRQALHDYFAWATTVEMTRYHASADDVPDGLAIPRWSWDGLQPR